MSTAEEIGNALALEIDDDVDFICVFHEGRMCQIDVDALRAKIAATKNDNKNEK